MARGFKHGSGTRRKVQARQRWVKATELMSTTDMTSDEIAAACGYSGKSSVWRAIWLLLDEQADAAREKYRALEDARLENAYDLVLREIEAGNLSAVDRLVKLSERRSRLRGLNEPEQLPVNKAGETEQGVTFTLSIDPPAGKRDADA